MNGLTSLTLDESDVAVMTELRGGQNCVGSTIRHGAGCGVRVALLSNQGRLCHFTYSNEHLNLDEIISLPRNFNKNSRQNSDTRIFILNEELSFHK